jgi:hypothetical protein
MGNAPPIGAPRRRSPHLATQRRLHVPDAQALAPRAFTVGLPGDPRARAAAATKRQQQTRPTRRVDGLLASVPATAVRDPGLRTSRRHELSAHLR